MNKMQSSSLSPVLFLPHGGGPLPLFGDPGHATMIRFLDSISSRLGSPDAILIISAHWEESRPTITSKSDPGLYYDYYNFPEEAYHIDYPVSGSSALTKKVSQLLAEQGIESQLDDQRDFDHGVFVPMKLLYPEANIPIVQLSLMNSLDPEAHIRLGQALAPLRSENVLIVGSGLSFHNMGAFRASSGGGLDENGNIAFEDWLIEACTSKMIDEKERAQRLSHWDSAPFARYCHPREEHLLPLHVCYGAGGSAAELVFEDKILGMKTSGFLWQD